MTLARLSSAAHQGKLCRGSALVLMALLAGAEPAFCQNDPTPADAASARVERIYHQASVHARRATNDSAAAWQFGRACFDWADFALNDDQREKVAQQGIAACRRAIELNAASAPAHYYLALNRGQLARTKTLGALKLVNEMEVDFKTAIVLDGAFDHAGPHRSLGLLYREAPGWPTRSATATARASSCKRL